MPEATDTFDNVVPLNANWIQQQPPTLPHPSARCETVMVRILCAACREPVGLIGLPHNGSYLVAAEFHCPCGQTTAWRSA